MLVLSSANRAIAVAAALPGVVVVVVVAIAKNSHRAMSLNGQKVGRFIGFCPFTIPIYAIIWTPLIPDDSTSLSFMSTHSDISRRSSRILHV
jgi:hypothetical protein